MGTRATFTHTLSSLSGRGPWLLLTGLVALVMGCSVEGLPPTLLYATPADCSGNVPVTASVSAVFSSPMDPSTLTTASFTVMQSGVPVAGSVSCSGRTATFTPSANLPGNSTFTATVTTAAKDAGGVAVASNQVWTFTTVSGPSGSTALFYAFTFGANPWTRSSSPVTLINGANVVSQTADTEGAVTITIANASGYEDNGFYYSVGTLQNLGSLRIVGSGTATFSANLYLDVDNDGEFFTWNPPNATVFAGLGADLFYTGPADVGGVVTIDSTTVFSGGNTLPQLRAGAVAGVNANTRAAVWIGISTNSGSQTVKITSVGPN
jgi:hypothetical protein